MRAIAAWIALLAASAAAQAQVPSSVFTELREAYESGCRDDDGNDRCSREAQDRMLAQYGLESAQDMLARQATMRRALFVDGYGNDIVAITFWHEPGMVPMVEVRSPSTDKEANPEPLRAAISAETWAKVLSGSVFFDRELAPTPAAAVEDGSFPVPPPLCLHAWIVAVTAVDAPRVGQNVVYGTGSMAAARDPALPVEVTLTPERIRSDNESACTPGLATYYAHELASIARRHLSECSSLSLDDFRNEAHLLGLCHQLRGDRLTAGEASVVPRKLQRALRAGTELEFGWLFVGSGTERQNRYLAAIDGGNATFKPPVGIDADHAVIEGEVVWTDENRRSAERADLRLNLLRVTGEFVIDTFEVSERRPYEPR